MKSNQLAHALLATTLAFSNTSQAEESKSYTLKTSHNKADYALKGTDTKSVFQAASVIIAEKTKDNTLPIGWKTNNFLWDIATIEDAKGQQVGKCRVIGIGSDNWKQSLVNTATLGHNKQPVQYKAYCWDGTMESKFSAQTPFTYEKK
jgi:hypothetical protein